MKGVYFLLKGEDVIYIGQSVNMERRLTDHCFKDYDAFVFVPSDNREDLEAEMIRLIKPIGNTQNTGIKKVDDRFVTNLRIDPKLAEKVKASADAAKRSMNKEIELVLEERYT